MKKIISKIKSKLQGSYDAKQYWKNRHQEFGLDFRGVGNKGLSQEENIKQYEGAKATFLELLDKENIALKGEDILDIGCGNGFYASIYNELQVNSYLGLDITDTLFKELRKMFANFKFEVKDVTKSKIEQPYNFISMIDVTQHITDDKKFSFAMQNVKQALSNKGVFVVTSWLDPNLKDVFYEKTRGLESYQNEFKGCKFSEPIKFRDKFIFTIRK